MVDEKLEISGKEEKQQEDEKQEQEEQWSLTGDASWSVNRSILLIRQVWIKLRNLILSMRDSSMRGRVNLVMLKGKSGRGKSVFLLHLIFFILLTAKKEKMSPNSSSKDNAHKTNPTILFVDRVGIAHIVKVDSLNIVKRDTAAATYKPDYYFLDNYDMPNNGTCSRLTLALTSGDEGVLKEFTKRHNEAGGITMFMPSLSRTEMALVFPDVTEEVLKFKFDVIAGNPRLFSSVPTSSTTVPYYDLVMEVVVRMFPDQLVDNQEWAVKLICDALNSTDKNVDSSTFRDYLVSGDNFNISTEIFCTTFMGIVASLVHKHQDATLQQRLLKLFGSSGTGNLFEFEAHYALLKASSDVNMPATTKRSMIL